MKKLIIIVSDSEGKIYANVEADAQQILDVSNCKRRNGLLSFVFERALKGTLLSLKADQDDSVNELKVVIE